MKVNTPEGFNPDSCCCCCTKRNIEQVGRPAHPLFLGAWPAVPTKTTAQFPSSQEENGTLLTEIKYEQYNADIDSVR